MRLSTAVAVASVLISSSAGAATYYVSPAGSDAANGSINTPFKTITKAAQMAVPGDVVNVRGGVYTDRASIYSKGTAAAPIVFRAMPGETPILDGVNTPPNKGVVEMIETEYVDFSGFEVRNTPYIGIMLWYARNTRLLDNHIHHVTRNAIYVGGDTTPSNFDITVSGNRIHDAALENQNHALPSGGWPGAVVISRTDRATLTNNRIWNNDGEGLISLRSNYHVIQGNEIFDNYSMNLYLDNSRFTVANGNLIYSTGNTRYYRNGQPATGIGVANETKDVMNPSSDNVFTNNIVIGTRWGFYYGAYESGGGLRNTKVLNNTFYGTTEAIIRIENDAHANSVVANNIFYQTGSPAPNYSGAGPVTYMANLWYGGTSGAAAGTGDIIGNPLFVNPGGRQAADYRLNELSPAIHTALERPEVTTDFWGTARTPTFDIGAHERSLPVGTSSPGLPALEAPTGLNAATLSNGTIQLSWAASMGGTEYRVYRDRALVATVAGTTWTDANVAPLTTYTYAVTTIDGIGNESAPSSTATVSTAAGRDSQAPTTVGALTATANGSVVTLAWQAATDDRGVAGYVIYRDSIVAATVAGTTWTDTSVEAGATYHYQVVAFDAAQNYSAPATATVTTRARPGRGRAVGR